MLWWERWPEDWYGFRLLRLSSLVLGLSLKSRVLSRGWSVFSPVSGLRLGRISLEDRGVWFLGLCPLPSLVEDDRVCVLAVGADGKD